MDAEVNPLMSIRENVDKWNMLEFLSVKRSGSWEEGCEWIYLPRCWLFVCVVCSFIATGSALIQGACVIEASGVLAVERNTRTPTHAQMLITVVCIYRSFMPLNASQGFSAPNSAALDSLTVFTEAWRKCCWFSPSLFFTLRLWCFQHPDKIQMDGVIRCGPSRRVTLPSAGSCRSGLFIAADRECFGKAT